MLTRQTVVDKIELLQSGHIQIRFGKLVVEDDKIISRQWHRAVIDPGTDLDSVLNAVNADLIRMNEAPCTNEKTSFSELSPQTVRDLVTKIHTPELVQKFRNDQKRRKLPAAL